jgi:peptidyl-Asp metalloendopeptidase
MAGSTIQRGETMSCRSLLLMLALSCPGLLYAADLFTALPSIQSDAARAAQSSAMDRLRSEKNTMSVATVGINVGALNGEPVTIDLPTARQLKAKTKKIDRRGPRDFTWYGELPGEPGTATLVVRGNKVTGTIRTDKELYRILAIGDGAHALVRIDEKAFPPEHPDQMNDSGDIPPMAKAAVGPNADIVFDVLVAYTAAAENRAGDILGLIQLAVDETNQAYENSGVNPRVRLVHAYKTPYSERGKSYDTIMNNMTSTTDANMPEIHGLRDQYGADMVVLIVDQGEFCGMADTILAKPASAFAMVHWSCATGNYSFGHELGHLQGTRHDPAADSTKTPFAYGHGYRFKQKWRTIMAYDCPNGCPRLNYFSNPAVLYKGKPMGTVEKSNNARVINETAASVSGFRPTAP